MAAAAAAASGPNETIYPSIASSTLPHLQIRPPNLAVLRPKLLHLGREGLSLTLD